ncbi:MAG: methyltransferase domain-containing protein [Acidobacteriota bacterium]
MNQRRRIFLLSLTLAASVVALAYANAQESRGPALRQAWSNLGDWTRKTLGETNTCPICGEQSFFRSVGYRSRPRAACGNCGSLERHRLLYLYLERKTRLFEDELSVLHFSPMRGLARALRAKENLHYVTSEYDKPADLQLDLTQLDLPDASWDVILCYHVFEHITEDRKAMREMYRVLKPGGWAVVQVPLRGAPDTFEDPSVTTPEGRLKAFGQRDHVRLYGWKDFAERLEEAGFEVTIEQFAQELDDEMVEEHSLSRPERIYFLRKPEAPETEATTDAEATTDTAPNSEA